MGYFMIKGNKSAKVEVSKKKIKLFFASMRKKEFSSTFLREITSLTNARLGYSIETNK